MVLLQRRWRRLMVVETIPLVHVFWARPIIRQKVQRQRKSDWYGHEKLDSKGKWNRTNLGWWQSKNRLEESCLNFILNCTEVGTTLAHYYWRTQLSTRFIVCQGQSYSAEQPKKTSLLWAFLWILMAHSVLECLHLRQFQKEIVQHTNVRAGSWISFPSRIVRQQ